MGIENANNKFTFNGVIYEDEVVSLRETLQVLAPENIICDFKECDDIHMAVLQLIMAYKKSYDASYIFSENKKIYELVLNGFSLDEDNCS